MSEPVKLVDTDCPHCGSLRIVSTVEPEVMLYGEAGPDQVQLAIEVVVRNCASCDECWTDWVTEAIRDAAVKIWKEETRT